MRGVVDNYKVQGNLTHTKGVRNVKESRKSATIEAWNVRKTKINDRIGPFHHLGSFWSSCNSLRTADTPGFRSADCDHG